MNAKIESIIEQLSSAVDDAIGERLIEALRGTVTADSDVMYLTANADGNIVLLTHDLYGELIPPRLAGSEPELVIPLDVLVTELNEAIPGGPGEKFLFNYAQLAANMRRCAEAIEIRLGAAGADVGPAIGHQTTEAAVTASEPDYVQIRVDIEYGASLPAGDYDTEALTAHVVRKSRVAIDQLHTQMAILTQESAHQFRKPAAEDEA